MQRNGAYRLDQPKSATYRNVSSDEVMPFLLKNRSDYRIQTIDSMYNNTKAGDGKLEVTVAMAAAAHVSVTKCPVFLIAVSLLSKISRNEINLGERNEDKSYAAVSVCVVHVGNPTSNASAVTVM